MHIVETLIVIKPHDGVRRRFHYIDGERRFHLELHQGCFSSEEPILISGDLSEMRFEIDCSRSLGVSIRISCSQSGMPGMVAFLDDEPLGEVSSNIDGEFVFVAEKDGYSLEFRVES